ncbi:MAG: decaprenylphospho-beta-D-erythro-pentofuranosid-2-ulose 2-reductase [Actinomycetota bacterium]|nr:decaprenylphospho-beta-D-erythro-pentofuranosid-2-ulose 2-reductase [Actinomycetota bacterium]
MKDALGSVESVLVLGGGSEIALATVRALVARRARTVVLAARRPESLRAAAEELGAAGATTVDTVPFDTRDDAETHARLVHDVFDRQGDMDLVLAAAGVLGDQAVAERDGAAARAIVHTNFPGLVSAIIACAERMRAQGHGTVAVLSTIAGERPRRSNFVYGSSKAGLDAFAQGLGDALAGTGVNVLVVRPGFVRTRMTAGLDAAPLATTPEGVAEATLDGLARGAHTVWAPPALRYVMSVLRHVPRPLFRRLPI